MGTGFSFELVDADAYDALRPDYAPEAVAWVVERGSLDEASLVVDLAAGTGQLSKRLVLLGLKLVAIEPARNMRSVIEERLPSVRALDGSAEAIPLADGSADAVVVGNAFHHFDAERAFEEIQRVLRPGGALALLGMVGCRRCARVSWISGSRGGCEGRSSGHGDGDRLPKLGQAAAPRPRLHGLRATRFPDNARPPLRTTG